MWAVIFRGRSLILLSAKCYDRRQAGICAGTKVQFPTGTEENVNKVIFLGIARTNDNILTFIIFSHRVRNRLETVLLSLPYSRHKTNYSSSRRIEESRKAISLHSRDKLPIFNSDTLSLKFNKHLSTILLII